MFNKDKLTLKEIMEYFYKYNKLSFQKETSNKMATLLIENFGFEDKKYYTHANKILQTYDYNRGEGTLFLVKDGLSYKFEIGQSFDFTGKLNGKGWFCADVEEYDSNTYNGNSFVGGQNKSMTFMIRKKD